MKRIPVPTLASISLLTCGLASGLADPATTGMAPSGGLSSVEAAQLAVANPALYPEFTGTVFTQDARGFWRESSFSPANQGFHWNQNGESYFLIDEAMGQGMQNLLTAR